MPIESKVVDDKEAETIRQAAMERGYVMYSEHATALAHIESLTREKVRLESSRNGWHEQACKDAGELAETKKELAKATAELNSWSRRRLRNEIDTLRAELAAAKRDGERLKWLSWCTAGEWEHLQNVRLTNGGVIKLHAAIDAAIEQGGRGNG